jgi:hypothetical protein
METNSANFIEIPSGETIPDDCDICVKRNSDFPIDKVRIFYKEDGVIDNWTKSYTTELNQFSKQYTLVFEKFIRENGKQVSTAAVGIGKSSPSVAAGASYIWNILVVKIPDGFRETVKIIPQTYREFKAYLAAPSTPDVPGTPSLLESLRTRQWWKEQWKVIKTTISTLDLTLPSPPSAKTVGTGTGIIGTIGIIGSVFSGLAGDSKTAKILAYTGNSFTLVSSLATIYQWGKAVKSLKPGAFASGLKQLATLNKTLTAVSKMSKLAKALTALAIALVWVVGIMQAYYAENSYEKGNAIAGAVGQTIAIIVLLIISQIPIIGALIAAIILLIDTIALIVCASVSEKDKRSTAGKWLCGGITGIISNLFTPYAGNVVVDPDDEYSHYRSIKPLPPTINSEFKIGNNITNKIKVIDYIERMPFPSTWMALPYFWQWNGQDEREASFAYTLGDQQKDMSYSINTGSQRNNWQSSSFIVTK